MFLCHFRGCTLLHRDSWEGSSLSADHQSIVISLKRSTVLAPSGPFHSRSASSRIIIAKLTKIKLLITYRSPLTGNFVHKNRVYHINPYAKMANTITCLHLNTLLSDLLLFFLMCSMHLLEWELQFVIKCIKSKDNCTVLFLVFLFPSLFVCFCLCLFSCLFWLVLSSIDVVRSVLNNVLSHIQKKKQNKDRNTSAQGDMHKEV